MENVMENLGTALLEDELVLNFNGPEDDEDNFEDDLGFFEIDTFEEGGIFNDDDV